MADRRGPLREKKACTKGQTDHRIDLLLNYNLERINGNEYK